MADPMTPERLAEIREWHEAGHDISYVAQGQLLAENARLRAVLRDHVCHTQGCGCQDETEEVALPDALCTCGHTRSEHGERACLDAACLCADWEDETIAALHDDEEPDVIHITDDDLLTILRQPLAKADDNAETLVIVDTMALTLALDAWDRAKTERDETEEALVQLRVTVLDLADDIARRGGIKLAHTLRTAAGQEASDE